MDIFGKKKISELESKISSIQENQERLDVEKTKKIYSRARRSAQMYYDAAKTDRTRA